MGSRRQWLVSLAVLVLLPVVGVAQRYTFRDYIDVLGNLNVNCVLQDHAGFIWLGTESGLFRYDGSTFIPYGYAEGVPGLWVKALHEDRTGRIWVGTTDGLAYGSATQRFRAVKFAGQDLQINVNSTLSSGSDGTVYAVTQHPGENAMGSRTTGGVFCCAGGMANCGPAEQSTPRCSRPVRCASNCTNFLQH
jgi:ligand-binding sensor domain-containing protein